MPLRLRAAQPWTSLQITSAFRRPPARQRNPASPYKMLTMPSVTTSQPCGTEPLFQRLPEAAGRIEPQLPGPEPSVLPLTTRNGSAGIVAARSGDPVRGYNVPNGTHPGRRRQPTARRDAPRDAETRATGRQCLLGARRHGPDRAKRSTSDPRRAMPGLFGDGSPSGSAPAQIPVLLMTGDSGAAAAAPPWIKSSPSSSCSTLSTLCSEG